MYYDNMIGGLVMNFAGPEVLKLGFHVFIVIVGVLILAGAVNTSLIGVNGVLNRVAEDGVLLDWFRKPHKKFGTTYRILNTMAMLQILTILASRGDVFLLGEAYAFGVVWSFALKALGVLVLRYQRHDQEYKMGWNIQIAGKEIPIGLRPDHIDAVPGGHRQPVFEKDRHHLRRHFHHRPVHPVHDFRAHQRPQETGTSQRSGEIQPGSPVPGLARPRCARAPAACWWRSAITIAMHHLQKTLEKTNMRRHDIVVMTVRQLSTGAGEYELRDDQLFAGYEQELFSHVVTLAEKEGKSVELLVVPAVDPFDALVQTATQLARLEAGGGRLRRAWNRKNWRTASDSPGSVSPRRAIRFRSKSPIPTALRPT